MTGRTCPGFACDAELSSGYLCRACQRRAERALIDLPGLTRELKTTVSRQDRIACSSKRADGAEQPLVVNLSASERGRKVLDLLFEWTDFVASADTVGSLRGLPIFAHDAALTDLVPYAAAILLSRTEWLRNNPQGPVLAEALHCIRRDLCAIVDRKPERVFAGPCRADLGYDAGQHYHCEKALYRRWGAETITCDGFEPGVATVDEAGCGAVHQAAERQAWLVTSIEDELLPLKLVWESLYVLLPGSQVDWHTARQWTRGRTRSATPRLCERLVTLHGVKLYRGGDVLDLARDTEARPGPRRRIRRVEVA